jgi:hypothetical protein
MNLFSQDVISSQIHHAHKQRNMRAFGQKKIPAPEQEHAKIRVYTYSRIHTRACIVGCTYSRTVLWYLLLRELTLRQRVVVANPRVAPPLLDEMLDLS